MAEATKFVADAMLGSTARKLRIFGYDTAYFSQGHDRELEKVGRDESRIILTSDSRLYADALRKHLAVFLVKGRRENVRLRALAEQAALMSIVLTPGETRCALCNGTLTMLTKKEAAGEVPATVITRHRVYFRCDGCSKVYWKGRHWERLRRLAPLLSRR